MHFLQLFYLVDYKQEMMRFCGIYGTGAQGSKDANEGVVELNLKTETSDT